MLQAQSNLAQTGNHPCKTSAHGHSACKPSPVSDRGQISPKAKPAASTHIPIILLKDGALQIQANGSNLSQILQGLASQEGMVIDGSVPNVAVYGTYGPGNSRQVITSLLTGLGYDFMMIGSTPKGVPQKLLLTARGSEPPAVSSSAQQPAPATTSDHTADAEQPGPGAITTVPPAGPDDPQQRAQQNLQRLQQMHDLQNKPAQPQ